ncbi:paeninodin family lasso peptide [Peribacillus frigoritolerans]|nr:paeninodin family lasso peptide [Peribacillus frigoritolerans]
MKKEWKKPELEVLDVKMTMLGTDGEYTDAAFPNDTPKGKLTFS